MMIVEYQSVSENNELTLSQTTFWTFSALELNKNLSVFFPFFLVSKKEIVKKKGTMFFFSFFFYLVYFSIRKRKMTATEKSLFYQ